MSLIKNDYWILNRIVDKWILIIITYKSIHIGF